MSEALALPCAVMQMRRGRVASQAVLMAAFAASVAAFCAAAFYTEGRLQSVDLRLDTIAEKTMPEIIALTEFRDSLHAAEVDLAAGVAGQSWSFDYVSTSVANARRTWARYANLHARSEVTVPPVIEQALLAISVVGDAMHAGRGDDAPRCSSERSPKRAPRTERPSRGVQRSVAAMICYGARHDVRTFVPQRCRGGPLRGVFFV